MHCCTMIFFVLSIQIIAEWLRNYSSYSPIPPMTQHSSSLLIFWTELTSLLIFWTFILMHNLAICYFCPPFWCTQLPYFVLFSNHRESSPPMAPTTHHTSSIAANPAQRPLWQPWYHPISIRCTAHAPLLYLTPNKINNAAQEWQCCADPDPIKHLHSTWTIGQLKHSALYPTILHDISIKFYNFVPGCRVGEFSFLCHMHFDLLKRWLSPNCHRENACHCLCHVICLYSFIVCNHLLNGIIY